MKYILSLFGKLLFYMGIPFSLMCIYVIYQNTNTNIESKKIEITFAELENSGTGRNAGIRKQLGCFNVANEKKYINNDFPIKIILKNDEPIDSLKYILNNNQVIKIGSNVNVWVPQIGDYFIKYENDSYING